MTQAAQKLKASKRMTLQTCLNIAPNAVDSFESLNLDVCKQKALLIHESPPTPTPVKQETKKRQKF